MAVPKRFKFKSKINNKNKKVCKKKIWYNNYWTPYLKRSCYFLLNNISMIFWLKFYSSILFVLLLTFNLFLKNFLTIILNSEFIIILIFFIFIYSSIVFNLNWIFGFSFIIVILGGLEVALSFLLLNL